MLRATAGSAPEKGSTIGGICADGAQIGAQIFVVVRKASLLMRRQWLDLPCVGLRAWRLGQSNVEPTHAARASQYTPVPDTYREEHQLGDHARLRLLIAPLPPDGRLDASAETARQTAQEARSWPGVSAC